MPQQGSRVQIPLPARYRKINMSKTLVFLIILILTAVSAFYAWQYFYRQSASQTGVQQGNSTQSNSTNNLSNTSSISTQNLTFNASEIKNCTQNSDCTLVRTQCCFNGLEIQETCINKNFEAQWNSQFNCSKTLCPQYIIPSRASCACENSACVLNYTSIEIKTLS